MDTNPKSRAHRSLASCPRNSTMPSRLAALLRALRARLLAAAVGVAAVLLATGDAGFADRQPDWIGSLTSGKGPGNFAARPPMRLAYRFGWSGIQAATADIHFFSPSHTTFEVDASGATSGFPRTLFRFDVYHQA